MKNQLLHIITILILASSCAKKVDTVATNSTYKNSSAIVNLSSENLGSPFFGTNVSWKINTLNPNNAALVVFNAASNNGHEVILIDNGICNNNTPVNAFRFISVNLENKNYKVILIKDTKGNTITNSVGRITRYTFGLNKKLYIATEGSYGGGGHIIEYNPNTQAALDLGKPFNLNGKYLDIYSLSVGSDNALYGGSFGGSGEVMTFRYNYNNNFYVDKTALDYQSRYVAYVSGDSRYTYASCGENNWFLYAIDRTNGTKKTILYNDGSDYRIEMNTLTNAPDAKLINTHYTLQNGNAVSLGAYNTPTASELFYAPYTLAHNH
jgi:hypothetical protein